MQLLKIRRADRCAINMNLDEEVHHWTKHLNVSKEDLQSIVDKVGNSATAVQKELAHKNTAARKRPAS
jgi:hypothetical protein